MRKYGLIGYPLSHSFSPQYFADKFANEQIEDTSYEAFPLKKIDELSNLLAIHPDLKGFNVTIPYKETIIPYLDVIEANAQLLEAVNTVAVVNGKLLGYNTDVFGFGKSLEQYLDQSKQKALVLGSGGASKAIMFALKNMHVPFTKVSRKSSATSICYHDIDAATIKEHSIIINCTPLGMGEWLDEFPDIPYSALSDKHLLYDLVYNPAETLFIKKGLEQGVRVKNGLEMLHLQAEKSWEIWQEFH